MLNCNSHWKKADHRKQHHSSHNNPNDFRVGHRSHRQRHRGLHAGLPDYLSEQHRESSRPDLLSRTGQKNKAKRKTRAIGTRGRNIIYENECLREGAANYAKEQVKHRKGRVVSRCLAGINRARSSVSVSS